MIENLEKAKDELKRVDHLIFVSLKYTRTGDVIHNVVKRMVSAYEFLVSSLAKKLDDETTPSPVAKAELIREKFKEELIQENITLYLLLRKVLKAEHSRECEFRRHVALICTINNEELKLNIDKMEEYYTLLKEFYYFVSETVKND
jgi:hypothetical protein